MWIAPIITGGAAYAMRFTVVERHIYAIGSNVEATRATRMWVERMIFWLFVLASFLVTIVGLMLYPG